MRRIYLFLLLLLLIPSTALSKTWTEGQTVSYKAPITKNLSYTVQFTVPRDIYFSVDTYERFGSTGLWIGWGLDSETRICAGGGAIGHSLTGASFKNALSSIPWSYDKRWKTGSGVGGVKWSAFYKHHKVQKYREYDFFAIHPDLKKYDLSSKQYLYYGFDIPSVCMGKKAAMKIARTVKLTPIKKTYKVK